MCYYYSIPGHEKLEKRFKARFASSVSFFRIFSVSGFSKPNLPVITNENVNEIQLLRWGLIPNWVKGETKFKKFEFSTLNARAETIHEKVSFRSIINKQRCLVLADGFFEWRHYQDKKIPYYVRLINHNPFALAGLWDKWVNPTTQKVVKTYSIITTKANSLIEKIHNKKRMPVLLKANEEKRWIKPGLTREEIDNFLVPFDESKIEVYPVSRLIASRKSLGNVPEAIRPMFYPDLPSIK
jgi:putative SOS response-associated peptidase YedK